MGNCNPRQTRREKQLAAQEAATAADHHREMVRAATAKAQAEAYDATAATARVEVMRVATEAAAAAVAAAKAASEKTHTTYLRALEAAGSDACIQAQPLPDHWDDDPTGSMLIELNALNPAHAAEVQAVTERFLASAASAVWYPGHQPLAVTRVLRIQNPAVHRAYQTKKAELLAADPSHSVNVLAWHGSRTDAIDAIVKSGFDISKGVAAPGALWFADQSGYSASYAAQAVPRRLLSVRLSPLIDESGDSIHIVRDATRMMPEHVIEFT